ncbi:MAG: hypothetical protein JNK33_01410 [Candidatus Doudnabacteria bacterium]|nr:hypothetical protein [Candidatus Doudnabacteria bacterium]
MSFFKKISASLMGKPHEPAEKSLIVTGRVSKIEKHPNADRLRIVYVDIGESEIGPVVCGATNFSEQDIVALALPGARIARNIHSETHEPFVLEKATIRGVESQGMICSGFELGLRETPETREEGILIFPPETALGRPV